MSEKLENKNKRKEGLTWGSPLCSPAAAGRPSQQAAQPASSSVVFVLDRGRGACPARARATAPRHQPPCLPGALLVALERPDVATPPPYPLTLPRFFLSSPSLSLSRVRTRRSPPFAIAIATGLPSPPRHAQELRPLALKLPVKPQDAGRPVEPPSPSSSTSGSDHHRRRFAARRTSPSPLTPSLGPR